MIAVAVLVAMLFVTLVVGLVSALTVTQERMRKRAEAQAEFDAAVAELAAAMQRVAEDIGKVLVPIFERMAAFVTEAVEAFNAYVGKHDDEVQP